MDNSNSDSRTCIEDITVSSQTFKTFEPAIVDKFDHHNEKKGDVYANRQKSEKVELPTDEDYQDDIPTLYQLSDDSDSSSEDEDWDEEDPDDDEKDENGSDDETEIKQETKNNTTFNYLKCWYTNAEFITNKLPEFKTRIDEDMPDIIAIVETGLKENANAKHYFPDAALEIEGYNMFRCDNPDEIKGGILVYTSSRLSVTIPKSKKLMNLKSDFKECILLDIHINDETVLFGAVYRKGDSLAENNKLLREIIDISAKNYDKILYCGDFNFPI